MFSPGGKGAGDYAGCSAAAEKWFYDSFERVIEVVLPSSVNKEQ
jgi:hypothetical protein